MSAVPRASDWRPRGRGERRRRRGAAHRPGQPCAGSSSSALRLRQRGLAGTAMSQGSTSAPKDRHDQPRNRREAGPASARRRDRALKALDADPRTGEDITVSGLARAARVDRTFLCRPRDLLERVHAAASTPTEQGPDSGSQQRLASDRPRKRPQPNARLTGLGAGRADRHRPASTPHHDAGAGTRRQDSRTWRTPGTHQDAGSSARTARWGRDGRRAAVDDRPPHPGPDAGWGLHAEPVPHLPDDSLRAVRDRPTEADTCGLGGGGIAAFGLGGPAGAYAAPRVVRRIGIGPAVVTGFLWFSLPLLLVPLADGPAPLVTAALAASQFGAGCGVAVLDISTNSYLIAVIPETLRSRVMGVVQTANFGVRPIGAVLAGTLGTALGLRPTLWIGTVGAVLSVLWVLASGVRHVRKLPETPSSIQKRADDLWCGYKYPPEHRSPGRRRRDFGAGRVNTARSAGRHTADDRHRDRHVRAADCGGAGRLGDAPCHPGRLAGGPPVPGPVPRIWLPTTSRTAGASGCCSS